MDVEKVLMIVKEDLGIRSTVRDSYIRAIVRGVITELEDEKGLLLDGNNHYHLLFVCDYAAWRYKSRDESGAMPRHLQYRLHNFMLHVGAKK